MARMLESQGNDKSSFANCNKKMSRSRHARRKYEIKRYNANAKTFRTIMRDQFVAGLTSDALRVEAIRKGHRHKTTQEKVKLREVVEVAKTFEATTFANQLMKTPRNTQQEQNQIAPVVTVFLVWWETSTAPSATLPCNGKKCAKCGIIGHFARVCRGGTRRQARQQQANFVFVTECYTTLQFARKYFANLHLIHGEETKVVKTQIDSAST